MIKLFLAKSGDSDALLIHDVDKNKNKIKKLLILKVYNPSWHPNENIIAFIGNNGHQSDVYI